MKEYSSEKKLKEHLVSEPVPGYSLSYEEMEEARLRKAINMSDMEKFRLFTRMLRINAMLKKAVITHKK